MCFNGLYKSYSLIIFSKSDIIFKTILNITVCLFNSYSIDMYEYIQIITIANEFHVRNNLIII